MKIRPSIAAVAALLAIGLVAQASGVALGTGSTINFASGSIFQYAAPSGTVFGYSTHPSKTCGNNAGYYTELLNAGATWQRTDLAWFAVQATSSASYVWSGYDCLINDAIANNISTIFVIDQTPTWAAYFNCASASGTCAPANATTLATFCTAAATHFTGRVTYWEIWNEQNSNGNWGPAATSSDYIADLNACYSAIKAVEPSATILSGGLSQAGSISVSQSVSDYLTGGATFDMLALHPYTSPGFPNDAGGNGWGVKVDAVRAQLNAAGRSTTKIAVTEYGDATCGPSSSSIQDQQTMAQQVIATSTSSYMNLFQPIFWYTLVDANSNDPSTSQNCFGVYYTNGQPKPAFMNLRSN